MGILNRTALTSECGWLNSWAYDTHFLVAFCKPYAFRYWTLHARPNGFSAAAIAAILDCQMDTVL